SSIAGNGTLGISMAAGTASDNAGNTALAAGPSTTFSVDNTAPTAPTVTGATPTNTLKPTWNWTAGGGGNGTFRYQLDSQAGTWTETALLTYTPTSNLTEASHTLYVQERDDAGNWSASGSKTIAIDAHAAPPVISGIEDDTGTVGDGITNDHSLKIKGTSEGNAMVEVFKAGVSLGTIGANGSGAWTYDHTGTSLPDGDYSFTAVQTDPLGNESDDSSPFVAHVRSVVADAGAERANDGLPWNAKVGLRCTFDGSGSYDPDGYSIRYLWVLDSKPAASRLTNGDILNADTPAPSFVPDMVGSYRLKLTVIDGQNTAYNQDTYVAVNATISDDVNAIAGPDMTARTNVAVTLDGRRSTPVGATFAWNATGGPGTGTFGDPDGTETTFGANVAGDYEVTLTVSQGGNTASDVVIVHVADSDIAPNADAGPDRVILTHTATPLDGSGSYDPDGLALAYQWSFISAPPVSHPSLYDEMTATPVFNAAEPGIYVLGLKISNAHGESFDAVLVEARTPLVLQDATSLTDVALSNKITTLDRVTRKLKSTADALVTNLSGEPITGAELRVIVHSDGGTVETIRLVAISTKG
ncbi:MAG: Ig-like domain-containing protein, partial [Candidatus Hydrogenedentes bacterium]|nr:Ig-like domain-containing protein [Candidatus Hydrogenedentota bacterium]